jgi:broad specificity polyphosphatase/5'/3'-nucleotidase SurE
MVFEFAMELDENAVRAALNALFGELQHDIVLSGVLLGGAMASMAAM